MSKRPWLSARSRMAAASSWIVSCSRAELPGAGAAVGVLPATRPGTVNTAHVRMASAPRRSFVRQGEFGVLMGLLMDSPLGYLRANPLLPYACRGRWRGEENERAENLVLF